MHSSFHLMNVTEMNKYNPRNYLVPNQKEINELKIGDLAKIVVRKRKTLSSFFEDERIWVKIVSIKEKKFVGVLEERSNQILRFKRGNIIVFQSNNITEVNRDNHKLVDQYKSALITCRAIQHGEINWAVKSTPLNKDDSGWQLFYGNEEYEYLDNPSNTRTISIKEVLNIEPLLEDVFKSKIESAEYNSRLKKFIRI